MFIVRCAVLSVLFKLALVKRNTTTSHTLSLTYHIGHHDSPVPHTWFLHHYMLVSNKHCPLTFPKFTNCTHLVTLLIQSGDVALNPGPVNFGFVNCRSVRNKYLAIADVISSQSLDIIGLTETHIRCYDTSSFLSELTPDGFKFLQVPRQNKLGGGLGFFVNKNFSCNIVSSPVYDSFEHMVLTVKWLIIA